MEDLITTTEAAKIAGVGVSSIKRWADSGRVRTVRTPGGHRRVVKADLLRTLEEQLAGAKRGASSSPAEVWADELLRRDYHALLARLMEARGRFGSWYAVLDTVGQGVRVVGERWAAGAITIAEEHVASENLRRALSSVYLSFPSSVLDPHALLVCVEGETHTLGLSMLQVVLREAGWGSLWLGGGMSPEAWHDLLSRPHIRMVALSASAAMQDAAFLDRFVEEVGAACAREGVTLVLGGSGAWPEAPAFGHRFGNFTSFHRFALEQLRV